ncbi:hypothetical protein QQF64_033293, partial [Cirrhinus molitorella]
FSFYQYLNEKSGFEEKEEVFYPFEDRGNLSLSQDRSLWTFPQGDCMPEMLNLQAFHTNK